MDEVQVKILFVLQFVGQPRFSKRITMMQDQGFHVEAIAFDRTTHRGRLPQCHVTSMSLIEHGKYVQRIPKLMKAVPTIRSKLKDFDVVYCMGADMGLLATLASIGLDKTSVVEVADVLPIQTRSGWLGRVARVLDRWQANANDIIVVTAPDFLDVYYRKWLHSKTQGFVLENKIYAREVSASRGDDAREEFESRREAEDRQALITIGYFGLMRCTWSWRVLVELARKNPDTHRIVLAGRPLNLDSFTETVDALDNVVYLGEYRSPDDLPGLYAKVDMVWACYDPFDEDDRNYQWARPNRFYESCLHSRPLVVRADGNSSALIDEYGLGYSIENTAVEVAAASVAGIGKADIDEWSRNMKNVPESFYLYTDEAERLADAIRTHIADKAGLNS